MRRNSLSVEKTSSLLQQNGSAWEFYNKISTKIYWLTPKLRTYFKGIVVVSVYHMPQLSIPTKNFITSINL